MYGVLGLALYALSPVVYAWGHARTADALGESLAQIGAAALDVAARGGLVQMVLYETRMGEYVAVHLYDVVAMGGSYGLVAHHGEAESAVLVPHMYDGDGRYGLHLLYELARWLAGAVVADDYLIRQHRLAEQAAEAHLERVGTVVCRYYDRNLVR